MFVVAGEFSCGNNGMRNSIKITGLATLICTAVVNAAELGPQNGASIQTPSKNSTGILISGNNPGTEVTASDINIDVSGKNNVYGFKHTGKNSNVDLGSGSSITTITEADYSIGTGDTRERKFFFNSIK